MVRIGIPIPTLCLNISGWCIIVNDPFVESRWGEKSNISNIHDQKWFQCKDCVFSHVTIIFGDVSRVQITNPHWASEKSGIRFDHVSETVKLPKTNLRRWLKMFGTCSKTDCFLMKKIEPIEKHWGSLAAAASQIPITWWKWVP
jgi:hypothetical protein